MKQRSGVLGQLLALGTASLTAKGAWFAFVALYCGITLSPQQYGAFSTALALALLSAAFYEGGFYPQVVRTVSQDTPYAPKQVGTIFWARFGLGVVGSLLLAGGAFLFFTKSFWSILLLLSAGLYVAGLGLRSVMRGVMEAHRELRREGGFQILERSLCITLAVLMVRMHGSDALWILIGLALGQAVACLVQLSWLVHRGFINLSTTALARSVGGVIRIGLPLALGGLLTTLYYRSDQVIVERYLGLASAGQYGLMYQLLLGINMLPTLVAESLLFPQFSRWHRAGRTSDIRRLAFYAAGGLFVFGVLVAVAVQVLTTPVLQRLGLDTFLQGSPILKALIWAFPLNCVHAVLNVALLAMERERPLLWVLGVAVVVSIGGVGLAVSHGLVAVAFATVATEFVVSAGCLLLFLNAVRSS